MDTTPLEHLILEQLVKKASAEIIRTVNAKKEAKPVYKRTYYYSKYKFGFLVDLVNNPAKYDKPIGLDTDYSKLNLFENEIDTSKYSYWDVSTALDVLAFNNDIIDNAPDSIMAGEYERSISLTPQGVISYRDKKYIEKELEAVSLRRKRTIEKVEYKLKKYWILIGLLALLYGYVADVTKPIVTKWVESWKNKPKVEKQPKNKPKPDTIQIPILAPTVIPVPK